MIKPMHTAFIDGLPLRFFRPAIEDRRPFDLPWHSADDLMIVAGLDPDERAEFRRGISNGLPDEQRMIVVDDVLTPIMSHPVAQGFCDAIVGMDLIPDLREAYDKAVVAAAHCVTLDNLLNLRPRRAI